MSEHHNCIDCGINTNPAPPRELAELLMNREGSFPMTLSDKWEVYVVHNAVWKKSGMPHRPHRCCARERKSIIRAVRSGEPEKGSARTKEVYSRARWAGKSGLFCVAIFSADLTAKPPALGPAALPFPP
jgi:hypothetical protein